MLWATKLTTPYKYAIINPPWNLEGTILSDSDTWSEFSLIDLFQQSNIEYLFLKVNISVLPFALNVYRESTYDLYNIISWYKVDRVNIQRGNNEICLRNRCYCEYYLVFKNPNATTLKSFSTQCIYEIPSINYYPECWVNKFVRQLNEQGYRGIIVDNIGVRDSLLYMKDKTVKKVELF